MACLPNHGSVLVVPLRPTVDQMAELMTTPGEGE